MCFSFEIHIFAKKVFFSLNMDIKEKNALEKQWGKKVCSMELNVEGFPTKIPFDIYDGYAVCEDYNGHVIEMQYPQMKAINDSKQFADAIMEYVGNIESADEISVLHILLTFNTIYQDGVELVPQEEESNF